MARPAGVFRKILVNQLRVCARIGSGLFASEAPTRSAGLPRAADRWRIGAAETLPSAGEEAPDAGDPIAEAILKARTRAGLTRRELALRLKTDQGNVAA